MTSKGGAAGSASERVLSLARRERKRMTAPSELSGWSIFFKLCFELEGKEARVSFAFRRVESVHSKSLFFSVTDVPAHVTFLWRHGALSPASLIISCRGPLYPRNGKRPHAIQGTCDDTSAGPHEDPLAASSGRPSHESVTGRGPEV